MLERRFIQELVHYVRVIYEAFCFGLWRIISCRTRASLEGGENTTTFFDEIWPKDLQQLVRNSY